MHCHVCHCRYVQHICLTPSTALTAEKSPGWTLRHQIIMSRVPGGSVLVCSWAPHFLQEPPSSGKVPFQAPVWDNEVVDLTVVFPTGFFPVTSPKGKPFLAAFGNGWCWPRSTRGAANTQQRKPCRWRGKGK